jgi:hypothetical protein
MARLIRRIRAATSLLEVSKDVLREWIIKVVGNDKRTGREAKRSRSLDGLDRTDLRDRAIMLGDDKRLALEYSVENSFGVSLNLFQADGHGHSSLAKIPIGLCSVTRSL